LHFRLLSLLDPVNRVGNRVGDHAPKKRASKWTWRWNCV